MQHDWYNTSHSGSSGTQRGLPHVHAASTERLSQRTDADRVLLPRRSVLCLLVYFVALAVVYGVCAMWWHGSGLVSDCEPLMPLADSATSMQRCYYEKAVKALLPQLTCQHSPPLRPFMFSGTVCSPAANLSAAILVSAAAAGGGELSMVQLSLPLDAAQLLDLRALIEPSTVGYGLQELLNVTVRHSRQLRANHTLSFSPHFTTVLTGIRDQLWAQLLSDGDKREHMHDWLGWESPRQWQLLADKLLLYETGDFFRVHRDVYKRSGQVLSVVLLLPTTDDVQFDGGQLRVRRSRWLGAEDVLWTGRGGGDGGGTAGVAAVNESMMHGCESAAVEEAARMHYAAFYSDCEHELQPVTRGARIALVLHFVRSSRSWLE